MNDAAYSELFDEIETERVNILTYDRKFASTTKQRMKVCVWSSTIKKWLLLLLVLNNKLFLLQSVFMSLVIR